MAHLLDTGLPDTEFLGEFLGLTLGLSFEGGGVAIFENLDEPSVFLHKPIDGEADATAPVGGSGLLADKDVLDCITHRCTLSRDTPHLLPLVELLKGLNPQVRHLD